MGVIVEHLSSFLRISSRDIAHGDPYEHTLGMRWLNPKEVELIGLNFKMSIRIWKDICDTLLEEGIERILFIRKEAGQDVHHWVDTKTRRRIHI